MISMLLALVWSVGIEAKTVECRFVSWNDQVLVGARVYVDTEFGFASLAQHDDVVQLIDFESVYSLPNLGFSFDRKQDCLGYQFYRRGIRENEYQCSSLRGNYSARFRLSYDRLQGSGSYSSTVESRDGWLERDLLRFSRCR